MATKPIRCARSACISLWELVAKWKGIPPFEMQELIDTCELQMYENTLCDNKEFADIAYLYIYDSAFMLQYDSSHIYSIHFNHNFGGYQSAEDNLGPDSLHQQ